MSHTPGPWVVEDLWIVAIGPDGVSKTIAEVHLVDGVDADACLIAAAPKLLEALKAALESITEASEFDYMPQDLMETVWFDAARRTIAKAEGRDE